MLWMRAHKANSLHIPAVSCNPFWFRLRRRLTDVDAIKKKLILFSFCFQNDFALTWRNWRGHAHTPPIDWWQRWQTQRHRNIYLKKNWTYYNNLNWLAEFDGHTKMPITKYYDYSSRAKWRKKNCSKEKENEKQNQLFQQNANWSWNKSRLRRKSIKIRYYVFEWVSVWGGMGGGGLFGEHKAPQVSNVDGPKLIHYELRV